MYPWRSSSRSCRREEVILTRLRIGHCHFSHGFILRNETPPICDSCQTVLSVEHVLLYCRKFVGSRRRHDLGNSLQVVLGDDDSALSKLFCFLRESRIYNFIWKNNVLCCFLAPLQPILRFKINFTRPFSIFLLPFLHVYLMQNSSLLFSQCTCF